MFAECIAASAGFDANHFYGLIFQEFMKEADGVRAATNAREKMRGQTLFRSKDLCAGFAANAGMKIAHHRRIRMRAKNGTEKVVRSTDVGDPVAHGFIDGVFQSAAAGLDADNFRAEHAHAGNIECLARHVFRAHVHSAFKAQMRCHGGSGNAVLTRLPRFQR